MWVFKHGPIVKTNHSFSTATCHRSWHWGWNVPYEWMDSDFQVGTPWRPDESQHFLGASDFFFFWGGGGGERKVYLTWTYYIWYTFCCHSWKVSAKSQIRLVTFIPFLWRYLEFLIFGYTSPLPNSEPLCFFLGKSVSWSSGKCCNHISSIKKKTSR